jgi:hypothetical protein
LDQRRRGRLAAAQAAVLEVMFGCGEWRGVRRVRADGGMRGLFGAALEDGVGGPAAPIGQSGLLSRLRGRGTGEAGGGGGRLRNGPKDLRRPRLDIGR